MFTNKFNNSNDLFELKYGKGGQFKWPYQKTDCVNWFCLLEYGWLFKSLECFLSSNDISIIIHDKKEEDFQDLETAYNSVYYTNIKDIVERERLLSLVTQLKTWPYSTLVCSFIFYILSQEIKEYGYIFSVTWEKLFKNLSSNTIGPELLSLIERNGLFELNSKNAIKAAIRHFICIDYDSLIFNKIDLESSTLRVLKSLKIDSKTAKDLTNQTLKNKDFNSIITFLKIYNSDQANEITKSEVQSFLKSLELSDKARCTLVEGLKNKLEASSQNWLELASNFGGENLGITLNIDQFYDDLIIKKVEKSKLWEKEQNYLALLELKKLINEMKEENQNMILHPSLSLVKNYIKINKSELNKAIRKKWFSPKINKVDFGQIIYTIIALGILFVMASLQRENLRVHFQQNNNSGFATLTTGVAIGNSSSPQAGSTRKPKKPLLVLNGIEESEKHKNQKQILHSPLTQPVYWPRKNSYLRFTEGQGGGYTSIGSYGRYSELKSLVESVRRENPELARVILEQIDHLLPSETRKVLKLKKTSSSGDPSASIIVPGTFNNKRTDKQAAKALEQLRFQYVDKILLTEYFVQQIEFSVKHVLTRDFTPLEQAEIRDLGRFMALEDVPPMYKQAMHVLIKQVQEGYIDRFSIKKVDQLLAFHLATFHHKWLQANENTLHGNHFYTKFSQVEACIRGQIKAHKERFLISESAIAYLEPNSTIAGILKREQLSLLDNADRKLRDTIAEYEHLDTRNKIPSLNKEVYQLIFNARQGIFNGEGEHGLRLFRDLERVNLELNAMGVANIYSRFG